MPETPAPETPAPETPAPETSVPETSVPETSQASRSTPEATAPEAATAPILAPALRRRVSHAAAIKGLARKLTVTTAAIAAIAGLGVGLPSYAAVIEDQQEVSVAAGTSAEAPVQPLKVVETPEKPAPIARDSYTVYTPPPPPKLQYPLTTGTGITSGFGPRNGRMHEGVDLFPGVGTPIQSIAAGVVVAVNRPAWSAMGQHVVVQHLIDGQVVTSSYAHMLVGSVAVSTGDHVAVGQLLGNVGETGNAQGAHLHFEICPGGGGAVNPYAWLASHGAAGG